MRPVLVPQFPNKKVAVGNSIVAVGKSVAGGLERMGGRMIAPPPSAERVDASIYGTGFRVDEWLEPTAGDRPRFTKTIGVAEDEYLLCLTPTISYELYKNAKVTGSMFSKPKLVSYLLYGPDETNQHRMHLAAMAEWPVIFNSAFTRQNWLTCAREYLSASEVRRIIAHSAIANIGIECDAIDAAMARDNDRDATTLSFSGRTTTDKGFERSLDIASKAHVLTNSKFRVTTFGKSSEATLAETAAKHSWIEPHYGLTRDEYYKLLWRSTGFTCFSMKESVGLAWLEKLYAGQIGMFWDRPWVRSILPWYALITSSKKEMEGAAITMLRNPNAMRVMITDARDTIRKEWDAALVPERVQAAAIEVLSARP